MDRNAHLESEVERLREALRRKERECEELIDQLKNLQEGILDSEKRMEEKMAARMAQMEEYVNGRLDYAKGVAVTSTPSNGGKSEKVKVDREEKCEEEDSESKEEELSVSVEKKKKKKKTAKNRRHERLMTKRGVSIDSLYGSVDGSGRNDDSESGEQSGSEYDVKRSILIREVPRPGKYELKGTKDIQDFFREYEKYCKERFSDNKTFWVKELGDFLDGRMNEFYKTIICVGDPKYEVVKQRMIEQVGRIKAGVKFRKVNDFDKVRMGKNERIDVYVHRIETLARKKFGDDGINENKDLMRKFLETVPVSVSEAINARRKEKMRWVGERLLWEDVLEMVEDGAFEGTEREGYETADVCKGCMDDPWPVQYKSYSEALKENVYEVVEKFMEDFYGREPSMNVQFGNRKEGMNERNNRPTGGRPTHGYNGRVEGRPNRGYNGSVRRNGSGIRENRNGMNQERKCFRCGNTGHVKAQCRWAQGACFSCGQAGHMARECRDPEVAGCRRCGSMNHWVRDCPEAGRTQVKPLCGNCGREGHFARTCKEPRSTCRQCGVVGHIAGMCWNTRRGVNAIPSQERRQVNQGDRVGTQGVNNCVGGNDGATENRNGLPGPSTSSGN